MNYILPFDYFNLDSINAVYKINNDLKILANKLNKKIILCVDIFITFLLRSAQNIKKWL